MTKDVTSPFTPGRPVPVEFFVGRRKEIERVRMRVRNAVSAERIEVLFVSGERGMGKSSLTSFVRHLCERKLKILGVHSFLGGVETVQGVVKRIFDHLLKEQANGSMLKPLKEFLGRHVREVGLFGISLEFSPEKRELDTLAQQFAPALRNLLEKVKDQRKGIFLVLDDINGVAQSPQFANWFKSLVDGISTSGQPFPVCVVLVGLEERKEALVRIQPSLARIFDPVMIDGWTKEESHSFFAETFQKINVTCDSTALDIMTRFTGGLPMLAHEIGDAVFSVDNDNRIDRGDAMSGVLLAADIVGRKHLDPLVYKSIRSPRYRTILRRLTGGPLGSRFASKEVRKMLPESEQRVFHNFLQKMKELSVIVEDLEGGRGSYRFRNQLHYLYFFLEAQRAASASDDDI